MTNKRQEGGSARKSTLVITNAIKLVGLGFGVKELLTTRDPYIVGACIVMMSGVQGLEQAIIKFAETFFGIDRK